MTSGQGSNITLPSIKFLLSSLEHDRIAFPPIPPQFDHGTALMTQTGEPVTGTVDQKLVSLPPRPTANNGDRNSKSQSRYIPRPRNAFILFRQHLHQSLFSKHKAALHSLGSFKNNSLVSREIGKRWKALSPEEKKYWQDLASTEKALHRQKYPNYKYIPRKVKGTRAARSRVAGRNCSQQAELVMK
ncbi:hypothetical protein HG536_0C04200 [Torulaspora globosa]|uniref:HMG box domain-containing protein n=1 Tax=Torulaspora globosa TaxID=48254 RepID=A0A7G3ZFG5_9SACH|nr:uncharacterized protein HG536_0C04200 [Torulaspora globosa]QLL32251.1 hypothetical protein HG536_0C04200 [Torulaspora globosa]